MSIRFAVLGAGRIGKVHAQAIGASAEATLVAVADAVPAAAQGVSATHGCAVRSIEAIVQAGDVDAVVICTPTDTHADLIEQCARAGKAIFCEKPIDLGIDRVKTCLEVVQESGVPLMVGFNRRFDPHFMAVERAVRAGKIGRIEQVQIISRDPGLPPLDYIPKSGGIFRDMTIHDFDMARFLLGEEPALVSASGSVLVSSRVAELQDYDTVMVLLETASGKQCMITNSRRATYGYDQRVEVHGEKGMIGAENLREENIEIATADGYTRPPLMDFFMTRYIPAYANEIAAMISAVKERRAPQPNGQDGLLALALAEAALLSVREGRKVRVSEILG